MPKAIIYPLSVLTFNHFLTDNGFTTQGGKHAEVTVWGDGERKISVPKKNELTQTETEALLEEAGLTMKFMMYMKNIQPTEDFSKMVKMSLYTPPIKKK